MTTLTIVLIPHHPLPFPTAGGLGLTADDLHRAALGNNQVGLLLDVLQTGVAHIHLLDLQHLGSDVAADGGGGGLVGVLTGGDAVIPIGVQHAGAADVGVAQHPLLEIVQPQPPGGGGEIVGQRRRHGLRRHRRRQRRRLLSPTQGVPIGADLLSDRRR